MSFRRKLWVDAQIQGILVGRVVIYWLAAVLYFGLGIGVSQYCDQPDWTYAEHWQNWLKTIGPWIPSTCLLLPLVIYDVIRTSHAFTGPIIRLRHQLNKLAQSPNCTPIVLRQDDYWQDLIQPVNNIQNQMISMHLAMQTQRDAIEELRNGKKQAEEIINSEVDSANSDEPIAEVSEYQLPAVTNVGADQSAEAESVPSDQPIDQPIGAAS
jgi:hypothetical protein